MPALSSWVAASAGLQVRWLNSYQNIGATLALYANGIVNLNNHNEDFGPVTFNGGEVDTGTGQFAIYQPLTVNSRHDGDHQRLSDCPRVTRAPSLSTTGRPSPISGERGDDWQPDLLR